MKTKKQILLDRPINKDLPIAFICSFCLGDTLMSLVTVNNFLRNGYHIYVFGDYAYALKDWFPDLTIQPLLTLEKQQLLNDYGTVLHMYESELAKQVVSWHPHSVTLSDSMMYQADKTMTDIQVGLCDKEFSLKNVQRTNSMTPLAGLVHRKNPQRIVVHPTSSLLRKNWPAKKFLSLARLLLKADFEVAFIVSPKERPEWLWVESEGVQLPAFESLSATAKWIYESGYFIGNDSGIGHLASNLGIPTVSIILRKGVAKQWRPTWAPGKVVLSPSWLNPRPVKEKFWKIFTTVASVKKAFDELVNS
jgi:heptosyltransferase-3